MKKEKIEFLMCRTKTATLTSCGCALMVRDHEFDTNRSATEWLYSIRTVTGMEKAPDANPL